MSRARHHRATGLRVRAERAFMKAVGGLQGAVFAAHAEIKPSGLAMIGFVSNFDGAHFVADKESGELDHAADVGATLAEKLAKKFGAS